jgi:hypothetical protein
MNHPKPEEWVPYVYGETTRTTHRQLTEHLQSCPQCREEVGSWQRSLKSLESWKVSRLRPGRPGLVLPVLKWAMAAAVVLFAGILIGRTTSPKVDMEKLRAAVVPQIQQELSAQMAQLARQEAARAAALTLASSRTYTDQMAQQLYVAVKKDVDILAFNTDVGLRHTAQQLVQLADFKQPEPLNTPNE